MNVQTGDQTQPAAELATQWKTDARWNGVERDYSAEDVVALRGSVQEEHTLARRGSERLWSLIHSEEWVPALGALTGNQAVQQVRAGLKAISLSGWQVAADANLSGQIYPEQSLYPANSVPNVVRRINNALLRADQIDTSEGNHEIDWLAPIVADAEAGFGGPLNAYELMTSMIASGAAGVHWQDQLTSEKKCGHMGGKVIVLARGHAYAPYADLLWVESAQPDLELARTFAESIHAEFPGKKLAYNCSPSFNWKSHLDDSQIAIFQRELAAMGYAFRFITLAGFHALNHSMYTLARNYSQRHMSAYIEQHPPRWWISASTFFTMQPSASSTVGSHISLCRR